MCCFVLSASPFLAYIPLKQSVLMCLGMCVCTTCVHVCLYILQVTGEKILCCRSLNQHTPLITESQFYFAFGWQLWLQQQTQHACVRGIQQYVNRNICVCNVYQQRWVFVLECLCALEETVNQKCGMLISKKQSLCLFVRNVSKLYVLYMSNIPLLMQ